MACKAEEGLLRERLDFVDAFVQATSGLADDGEAARSASRNHHVAESGWEDTEAGYGPIVAMVDSSMKCIKVGGKAETTDKQSFSS